MQLDRREEILDALINIFRDQGVGSDFTISQLANEVNIGKSTIYEYFKTKEEIIQHAIFRVVDEALTSITGDTIRETDFESMFKQEGYKILHIAKGSRFLFNLVSPHDSKIFSSDCKIEIQHKMEEVRNFYLSRFAEIFQKGIEEGLLKQELVFQNQLVISSIVIGNIFQVANGRVIETASIDIEVLVNTIYDAIIKLCN